MVNDNGRKITEIAEETAHTDVQRKIIYDSSNIRRVYANVARLSAGQEEVVLQFGIRQSSDTSEREAEVRSIACIILNPFAAKRLALLLDNALQDYEAKYGTLETEPRQSTGKGEKADLLFQLVKELDVQIGIERSFKLAKRNILSNRFLLGTSKKAIGENAQERISDICVRMDMPEDFLEKLDGNLPDADYIHFGFEEQESACIYKVYLEFYEKIEKEIKVRPNASDHFLMHRGFKWVVSDNTRKTITDYTLYPSLSVEKIMKKLSKILDPNQQGTVIKLVKDILGLAVRRVHHSDILYLEVSEGDNPRKSFDINMYRANLQLCELYPFLLEMCRYFSIDQGRFYALYKSIRHKTFGHLSGGVDREGMDFFTVYYGVEKITGRNANLGSPSENLQVTEARPGTYSSEMPPLAGVERTDKKAGFLFKLVNELGVRIGVEHSFKILRETLISERFLMGFQRPGLSREKHRRIINICREIEMPQGFLKTFQERLHEANIVLFGFEKNKTNRLYKSYLEFGGRFEKMSRVNPRQLEPFLIHQGFKWDASDNRICAKAAYTCFPLFPVENMLERLPGFFYDRKGKKPSEIAEGIVKLASQKIGYEEFLYFEVSEEGNPRKSFDINMYRANLQLSELYPFLLDIVRYYSIPDEQFHALYEPVKSQIFGHLSGGIDRQGRDFLTLYFGVKGSTRSLIDK
jgi:hypothetical protein